MVAQNQGKGKGLSVAPSFLDFAPGLDKAFLYPVPNCWYASVLLRGVCLPLNRPLVGGSWMPLPSLMSPLVSPRPWGSRLTPTEVWRPQGLFGRCSYAGHLQRCGMVHAPNLRQILWPRYAGHSRLFRSLT